MIPKDCVFFITLLFCLASRLVAGGSQQSSSAPLRPGSLASMPRLLKHAQRYWTRADPTDDDDDKHSGALDANTNPYTYTLTNLDDDDDDTGIERSTKEETPESDAEQPRPLTLQEQLEALPNRYLSAIKRDTIYGDTALTLAASDYYAGAVEILLLDGRCDPNRKDRQGYTALIIAGDNGCSDVIAALLKDPRTDPNAKNNKGNTALLCAVLSAHVDATRELLLDERTDIHIEGELGKTAPELALYMQVEAIIALFSDVQLRDARKKIATRFIAHLFNLKKLSTDYSAYESNHPALVMHLLASHLIELMQQPFNDSFWMQHKEALMDYLAPLIETWKQTLEMIPQHFEDLIHARKACSIPVGHENHYVSVSICGNWVAIGNRGLRIDNSPNKWHLNTPGIYFYLIPEITDLFSWKFISGLRYGNDFERLRQIQSTHYSRCIHVLQEPQLRPNCTYASGKLDIKAHLYFFVSKVMGFDWVEIENTDDSRWVAVTREVEKIYSDFATLGRILVFNEYADRHFNPNDPDERMLLACMYQTIKKRAEKEGYGTAGYFQVIRVLNRSGEEMAILDQLNSEARTIAEAEIELAHQQADEPSTSNAVSWYDWILEGLLGGSG